MFRNQTGLAVEMVDRVFDVPSLNGILPGEIIAQALPSILAAQVSNMEAVLCMKAKTGRVTL
jgi:hypothetical protein